MPRLLLANHASENDDSTTALFAELGFSVASSSCPLDALARCEAELPEFLIVDSALPGALELIGAVRLMSSGTSVRILYGVAEANLRGLMAAKQAGADDFLLKPYDAKVLYALFDGVITAADVAAA